MSIKDKLRANLAKINYEYPFKKWTTDRFKTLSTYLDTITPFDEEHIKKTNILFIPNKNSLFSEETQVLAVVKDLFDGSFTEQQYKKISFVENGELRGGDLVIVSYIALILVHQTINSNDYFGLLDQYKTHKNMFVVLPENVEKYMKYILKKKESGEYEELDKNISFEVYKNAFFRCFDINDQEVQSLIPRTATPQDYNNSYVDMDYIRKVHAEFIIMQRNELVLDINDETLFDNINDFKSWSDWIRALLNQYELNKEYSSITDMKEYLRRNHSKYKIRSFSELLTLELPPKIPEYIKKHIPNYMTNMFDMIEVYDRTTDQTEKRQIIKTIAKKHRMLLCGDRNKTLEQASTQYGTLFYKFYDLEYKTQILSLHLVKFFMYKSLQDVKKLFRACVILENSGNPFYVKETPIEKYEYIGMIIINTEKLKLILVYKNKINLIEYEYKYFMPLELGQSIVSNRLNKQINATVIRLITQQYIRQIDTKEFIDEQQTFILTGDIYVYKLENKFLLSKHTGFDLLKELKKYKNVYQNLVEYMYSETDLERKIAKDISILIKHLDIIKNIYNIDHNKNKFYLKNKRKELVLFLEAIRNRKTCDDIKDATMAQKIDYCRLKSLLTQQDITKCPGNNDISCNMYHLLKNTTLAVDLLKNIEKIKQTVYNTPMYDSRKLTTNMRQTANNDNGDMSMANKGSIKKHPIIEPSISASNWRSIEKHPVNKPSITVPNRRSTNNVIEQHGWRSTKQTNNGWNTFTTRRKKHT